MSNQSNIYIHHKESNRQQSHELLWKHLNLLPYDETDGQPKGC